MLAESAAAGGPEWTLSGFGDEIDPNLEIQLAVLQALGAQHLELRSVDGVNVADFDAERTSAVAAALADRDMSVSAIASPIGKVDIALPIDDELERLRHIIDVAHALETRYVRIFSFFRAEGVAVESTRDRVLTALRAFATLAERESVILLHENEKEIYGDVPSRVLDLVESVGSESLRLAWDSANFVQVGVRPHSEAYAMLRPHLEYLQVKDALLATGEVVPAGDGDGELRETLTALRDDGYTGFASLEPHLTDYNTMGGFSGPAAFGTAARAFAGLLTPLGIGTR